MAEDGAGCKTAPIMPALQDKGIEMASIDDMRSELITQSKHPREAAYSAF